MRVLFSTTAGAGHFGPMVPFAKACRDAGHEVKVAAPESFANAVVATGLDHAPFADVPPEILGPIFGRLPELSRVEADRTVMAEVFGRPRCPGCAARAHRDHYRLAAPRRRA